MSKPNGAMSSPYIGFAAELANQLGGFNTVGTEQNINEIHQNVIPDKTNSSIIKVPLNSKVLINDKINSNILKMTQDTLNKFLKLLTDNNLQLNELSSEQIIFSNNNETFKIIRTK